MRLVQIRHLNRWAQHIGKWATVDRRLLSTGPSIGYAVKTRGYGIPTQEDKPEIGLRNPQHLAQPGKSKYAVGSSHGDMSKATDTRSASSIAAVARGATEGGRDARGRNPRRVNGPRRHRRLSEPMPQFGVPLRYADQYRLADKHAAGRILRYITVPTVSRRGMKQQNGKEKGTGAVRVGPRVLRFITSRTHGIRGQQIEQRELKEKRAAAENHIQSEQESGKGNPPLFTESAEPHQIHIKHGIADLRKLRREVAFAGRCIGLVPTMGALHEGHLDLIRLAAGECDEVYVSIYVNPTQFGANEDFGSYPKTFDEDLRKLKNLNTEMRQEKDGRYMGRVTTIFQPSTEEMYPVGLEQGSHIAMNTTLTQVLEGKARPTFFRGVTTVVMKLLNSVQPDKVYFGQKDIQQLVIVQRMINEFHLPVVLRRCPTRRHSDGLAMSSRNIYLGKRRRAVATVLNKVLYAAWSRHTKVSSKGHGVARKDILDDAFRLAEVLQKRQRVLPPHDRARFEVDYLSLADPVYLNEVEIVEGGIGAILSGAVIMLPLEEPQPEEELGLGDDMRSVRLIDNFLLGSANKRLGGTL